MTAVPVAGTLLGAVAAVAVVAVALTFTASLDHLFSTPRLYGQNSDYATNYTVPSAARIRADRAISDAARGEQQDVVLDGRRVPIVAMDDIKGRIGPVVTEGRQPERSDEIVLTRKKMDALGVGVGDSVEARVRTHRARLRVVGQAVMPESVESLPRPSGAMTFQAFKQLSPHASPGVFEARVAPGADRAATIARLERAYIHPAPGPPKTIADFEGIHSLPVVVSALLAAIAAATLAHTLVTAIRRRRRQLAVLKTLGFDRRQLLLTVAWQATTFAAIGVVVGLPLGIAAGRWTWYLFAQQIEVVPEPVTPVPLVLLVVPAALLLANLVAALPAWSAARTRAAAVLRAE
jgi:ABC-type lipoprotein release transport system permease subunit